LPAASLRTIDGRKRELEPLREDLLTTLRTHYDVWRAHGLAALHGEIAARDALRGRRVTVGETSGIAAGIRDDGRLQLDTGIVESGEVTF
jgi:biotin-(acetyl-CoA carboxylase) ligase